MSIVGSVVAQIDSIPIDVCMSDTVAQRAMVGDRNDRHICYHVERIVAQIDRYGGWEVEAGIGDACFEHLDMPLDASGGHFQKQVTAMTPVSAACVESVSAGRIQDEHARWL